MSHSHNLEAERKVLSFKELPGSIAIDYDRFRFSRKFIEQTSDSEVLIQTTPLLGNRIGSSTPCLENSILVFNRDRNANALLKCSHGIFLCVGKKTDENFVYQSLITYLNQKTWMRLSKKTTAHSLTGRRATGKVLESNAFRSLDSKLQTPLSIRQYPLGSTYWVVPNV